jgi:hypothetical protein
LLSLRFFDPSVRLTGYGLIALIMGFRPLKWARNVWLLYGLVSLVVGVTNGMTVNCLGSNDPRYAQLASEFGSYYRSTDIVATNSFHILDIHANIASAPVENYGEAEHYQKFFWVTLPEFDALPLTVTPMPRPGQAWCEEKQFRGDAICTMSGDESACSRLIRPDCHRWVGLCTAGQAQPRYQSWSSRIRRAFGQLSKTGNFAQ